MWVIKSTGNIIKESEVREYMAFSDVKLDHSTLVVDSLEGNGRLLATGANIHEIVGEVEILYRTTRGGKVVFTRTKNLNDLLITGAVYISEKVNNMRSTFKTVPIDVSLGIHTVNDIDTSDATVPFEKICGIMVGNGGTSGTYNAVHKVHKTDLSVPGMIPFRVRPLDDDLPDADKKLYLLRRERNGYAEYYGKRFTDREINVVYEDGTSVGTDVNLIGDSNGKFVKTFTKYTVGITPQEIREYFKITEGNTMRSLINSVGLMTGYPMNADESEFGYVRGMTTLNTENMELKNSQDAIEFTYRLYFI